MNSCRNKCCRMTAETGRSLYRNSHRSSFFPLAISASTNTICPPSSPGTGRELITARLIEITAANCKRAAGLSSFATVAPTFTIATGPDLSSSHRNRISVNSWVCLHQYVYQIYYTKCSFKVTWLLFWDFGYFQQNQNTPKMYTVHFDVFKVEKNFSHTCPEKKTYIYTSIEVYGYVGNFDFQFSKVLVSRLCLLMYRRQTHLSKPTATGIPFEFLTSRYLDLYFYRWIQSDFCWNFLFFNAKKKARENVAFYYY